MRGLWLYLLMFPTTALSEVCDKERPLWTGGPVSAWDEALWYLTSPAGWLLLIALIIALIVRRRRLWFVAGAVAALTGWAAYKLPHLDDPRMPFYELMQQEGCLGPPHLSIALCGAISVLSFYAAMRRPKTKKDTTCSKD